MDLRYPCKPTVPSINEMFVTLKTNVQLIILSAHVLTYLHKLEPDNEISD